MPTPAQVHAIQIVLRVGKAPEVRLNDEVRGQADVRATRDIAAWEEIRVADIDQLNGFTLTADEDPDPAHITAIALKDGWGISFNTRYNAQLIAEHRDAADEFIAAADDALKRKNLRPFAEAAYGATELLVRAELLSAPDQALLKSKKHAAFASRYHQHTRDRPENRFAQMLKRLEELRAPARYVDGRMELTADEAARMLATLRTASMRRSPRPCSSRAPR